MKKSIILLLCIIIQPGQIQPVSFSSFFDYFFSKKTNNITRAGVGIIVPLHHGALQNPTLDNYGIIVGHDRNLNVWMIGQAGKVDSTDKTLEEAASRELFEETGGLITISHDVIKQFPSIKTEQNLLFLMKSNDLDLAQKIHRSVQKAQKNPNLPLSCKEIDNIVVVKLSALLKLCKQIESNMLKKSQYKKSFFSKKINYYIAAENGSKILLDGYYTRMFGNNHNLNAHANAKNTLKQLVEQL